MRDRSKEVLAFFQKQVSAPNGRPQASPISGQPAFISGEEIAKELGFSRTAVWNHIDTLRQLGYEFEASPRLGYRLLKVPDRLFPDDIQAGLVTKFIGRKIYYYDVTESTNNVADQLARDGAPEGTLVLAEYQTKGRGRMEREWFSPKGRNILMSVVLRPRMDPGFVSLITVMSSVAVARAIRSVGLDAQIKWPNDVYIEGRKVSGILTEMKCEQDRIKHLVLGIGINVNMLKSEIPLSLHGEASSLSILKGAPIDRKELLKTLLCELEMAYDMVKDDRCERVLGEWSRLSFIVGKWVEVSLGAKKIEGVALGTDSKGALLLKLENGFVEAVLSGDVHLVKRIS